MSGLQGPRRNEPAVVKCVAAATSAPPAKSSRLQAKRMPLQNVAIEMSALVKLVNVSKRYGEDVALHPTSLSVARGKTTVLIGPSGCGKSTLLRLIIRLIEADSGWIEFDGEPMTSENIDQLRRRVGYVIQEGGLFPHLTACANVLLMARQIRKPEEEMDNRLLE